MAKITLGDVTNLNNQTSAQNTINNNSDLLEAAIENTLSRDGTSPNEMNSDLDMNGHRIINNPAPFFQTDFVRLTELNAVIPDISGATDAALEDIAEAKDDALAAVAGSVADAASSASSAAASATSAANSATSATNSKDAAAASVASIAAYAATASNAASAALTSEINSAASEASAEASETSAASSASSASASATNASGSAADANSSALTAQGWAESSKGWYDGSEYWYTQTEASATAAAASATTASTAATNAGNSATTASTAATTATTKAGEAATSATNAGNSETAAATSETNAAASATSASTSATNAATSETNAATSETNAASSESAAAGSASAAAGFASAASTSEDAAAASATAAAGSATSADTSATDAADAAQTAIDAVGNLNVAATNLTGGTTGQYLLKNSNTNYDYAWADQTAGGDMLKSTYDPTSKAADAFDMTNMVEGTTNKIFSATERTKLSGIATGATDNTGTVTSVGVSVPTGMSVASSPVTTSGTIALTYAAGYEGFTTTQAGKLAGIATGATANSSDATLLARANHTGTQAISTVSGLQTALDSKSGFDVATTSVDGLMSSEDKTKLDGVASGATDNTGTVTSVNLTAPASGITVSGGPITTNGSITLALSADLAALEGLSGTGIAARTAANTWAQRSIAQPAAGITVTNGDGVSGNPTIALANDLSALEGLSGTGIAVRTGTDTWTNRTLTAPASGVTITNGNGVSGNPTLVLANDLAAVEGLSTTGFVKRTGTDTWSTSASITQADMETIADGTFLGNISGSTAVPSPVTTAGLRTRMDAAQLGVTGQSLTGGANTNRKYLGNTSTGNIAVDPGNGPLQSIVNGGAAVISPASGKYGLCTVRIQNSAGSGTLTFTGYYVVGDAFDNVAASRFYCSFIQMTEENYIIVKKVA